MGRGWRRAFCTTIPRERESKSSVVDNHNRKHQQQQQQQQRESSSKSQGPSPRSGGGPKLGFFGNPSTPRLRSRQPPVRCNTIPASSSDALISPRLLCKTTSTTTTTPKSSSTKSPKTNPSSPRSPFAILKNTLRLSRSGCGVCMQSVKTGQGMAIYTAECSHTFHFPCIASHVRKQGTLVCPVCHATWKDVPLLAIHKLQQQQQVQQQEQEKEIVIDEGSNKHHYHHASSTRLLPNVETKQESWHQLKTYNDDEPLASPTASKFNAILEAVNEEREAVQEDEQVEDEIEEFKGFFVNPVSSDEGNNNNRNVEASLTPEAALVSVGPAYETYAVVLKLKAPRPPPLAAAHNSSHTAHVLQPARRAPIDLVTVLDVSGSMSGPKLQMLKRAMRLVISSLGSADRLSIVAFSAAPKRLMPLRRMTAQGQRAARRIVDRLVCSQGTSVGEALRKATKVLEDRRERNPVASIMLLSDGQDEGGGVQTSNTNQRQRSTSTTHVSSTRFGHVEIPVHSSGFGGKAARCSQEAAEEDAFTKCVGGLLCVVVQDLRVQLEFAAGSDPAEISAAYLCSGRPTVLSSGAIRVGDFYAEEEREVLLEVRVPRSRGGTHHVLSVKWCYKDPPTQHIIHGGDQALLVPRLQPLRSFAAPIQRLRNLFITTRAIAESRRFIELNQHELTSAIHLLSSARALLLQSSQCQSSADEYVKSLEAELAELQCRRQRMEHQQIIHPRRIGGTELGLFLDENGEPLTPTSAWRAAEKLAKVAEMKKSMNRVSDLHGFENARF